MTVPVPTHAARGRGFSLVELLVAMAVIGILAALLLPALSRAKQSTWRVACLNNLRQLSLATQLYWNDHDQEAFRWRGDFVDGGDLFWFGWLERGPEGSRQFDLTRSVLWPYLEGRGIEVCPSFNYGYSRYKRKATSASHGYGYNLHLSSPATLPPVRIDRIPRPSHTALFADAAQVNTFQAPATPDHPLLEEFYYINRYEPTVHFRHQDKANVVFLDGHIETAHPVDKSLDSRLPNARIGRIDERALLPFHSP